jgi:UDP-N-acetylmuramate dehydrogenase
MTSSFRSTLFGDLDVDLEHDVQIGALTYYGIGGVADALVRPRSADALSILLRRCYNDKIPCRILGKGANLLIDDVGVDGIVIKLDHHCFTTIRFTNEKGVDVLHAMAGADLAKVVMKTVSLGLSGLTAMAGIPATVGGAIRMNAGGLHGCISDSLSTVTCISSRGELATYNKSELTFNYRSCKIAEPLILSASFDLQKCDPIELREEVKENFAWKKSRQPLAEPSAGCVFKNPIGENGERVSAGKLIDDAGLKGTTIGGASVSEHHANFITTSKEATSSDVITLIQTIKDKVLEDTGIILKEEVVIWSRNHEVQR